MTRLTRWARWMLPPKEARDVIADYRDIVDDPELFQNLSRPRKAVRSLAQTKPYRIWLAVFIALSACILIPGVSPLPGMWAFWTHCFYLRYFGIHIGSALAFLGMAGALVWFRWKGYKEARLPRAIPVLLVLLLAWTGAVLLVNWLWMRDPLSFSEMWGETPLYALFGLVRIGPPDYTVSRSVHMLQTALEYGGFPALYLLDSRPSCTYGHGGIAPSGCIPAHIVCIIKWIPGDHIFVTCVVRSRHNSPPIKI